MDTASQQSGRTIAFDFDGVIATYAGYEGGDNVREPIAATVEAIKQLKEQGYKILIHSTRSDEFLQRYFEEFAIPYDYINRRPDKEGGNPGKPIAYVYVDDRAICYQRQSAEELVDQIVNFKAHWE